MRTPGFVAAILSLVGILSLSALDPPAARGQQDPVAGQPVDPNYADQYDSQQRDQRRQEQEERRGTDPCELGCGDHEGLQTRGIPDTRLVAVIHRTELDDGVLTVRLRFINEGEEPARLSIDPTGADAFLLRVGEEEYEILRNGDGDFEAKDALDVELKPGKMETWWAKFPAPPDGTRAFDLDIPPAVMFRNVRLED